MFKISKDILKDVSQLSLEDELQKLSKLNTENIAYKPLSSEQVDQLAQKIALLPLEYRNILFFRYCFNITPSDTEEMLEIENSISKLRYIEKLLSELMGLKNSWIDNESMEKACQIALAEENKNNNTIRLHQPNYSKDFRRKLKEIKIKRNSNRIFMSIAKKVAVFILVFFLSFSAVLVVNAEAREKVFDWIIEKFPKFSIFISKKDIDEDNESVELTSFIINYIPEGFELVDINQGCKMLIYNYLGENNQKFYIKLLDSSDEGKSYYDTEGVDVEEIIFKGGQGYRWQTDDMAYLIWHEDGIEFHIVGNLDKDEILKLAENILK